MRNVLLWWIHNKRKLHFFSQTNERKFFISVLQDCFIEACILITLSSKSGRIWNCQIFRKQMFLVLFLSRKSSFCWLNFFSYYFCVIYFHARQISALVSTACYHSGFHFMLLYTTRNTFLICKTCHISIISLASLYGVKHIPSMWPGVFRHCCNKSLDLSSTVSPLLSSGLTFQPGLNASLRNQS